MNKFVESMSDRGCITYRWPTRKEKPQAPLCSLRGQSQFLTVLVDAYHGYFIIVNVTYQYGNLQLLYLFSFHKRHIAEQV